MDDMLTNDDQRASVEDNQCETGDSVDARKTGWLYFIQCGDDDGPVKVGIATDLKKRLSMLQVGCPFPLRVIAALEVEKGKELGTLGHTELTLHRRLRPARIRGEWFDGKTMTAFVRQFIAELTRRGVRFTVSTSCAGSR